jgi:hypothetical protein
VAGNARAHPKKSFFSEEKKQKTFTPDAYGNMPAKSRIYPLAQKQKSFGSFLQKRTFFAYRRSFSRPISAS